MYLTLGMHFCGGEVVETQIMFGESHLGCQMADMEEPCPETGNTNENANSFDKVPCCENEYHTLQSTNEFVKDAAQISLSVDFAVAIIYRTLNLDIFPKSTHPAYTDYDSPPLEKDVTVLFQTFLS